MNPPASSIDFYFDFISPYGYFAATRIDALARAHGREVRWHAFHMRSTMADFIGQTRPLVDVPLKGAYIRHDVTRMARWFDVPYQPAGAANFSSTNASRAFWLIHDRHPAAARLFAREIFRLQHAAATSPNTPEQVAQAAADIGIDLDGLNLSEAVGLASSKDRLRDETAAAVTAGVWGTPTFVVDGEMFWGADRLGLLDDWLDRGGW